MLHTASLTLALGWLRRALSATARQYWRDLTLLIMVASWTLLIHLAEISLWALYYTLGKAMPDIDSALYFSAVTYTTVGYGDLVLPERWRLVGGVEALTGILMCGWSTGFFFAICSDLLHRRQSAAGIASRRPEEGLGQTAPR